MGFRFSKSIRVGKYVRVNLSKRGVGASVGVKGARIGVGPRGTRITTSIPGTGISYSEQIGTSRRVKAAKTTTPNNSNISAQRMSSQIPSGNNIKQSSKPTNRMAQRHRYSGRTLATLIIGCIALFILLFVSGALSPTNSQDQAPSGLYNVLSTIGGLLLVAIFLPVLITDWRGFITLNGLIKWRSMPVWLRVVLGFFVPGFSPFMLAIYLFQAFQTYRYFKQQEPLERRHKIAELEAQMGLMPHTEGACRSCQKPLQLGAEYCAYCGAPVIEQPRICPNCATTTFPDAKWCPKCHHPLYGVPQGA